MRRVLGTVIAAFLPFVAGALPNPNQVAMLRWYEAIQTGDDIAVGRGPNSLVFDGAHIWVSNGADATATKIRAADGAIMGTYPTQFQAKLAFDGIHIWTTNAQTGIFTKLKASDGTTVDSYNLSATLAGCTSIAFDGSSIWAVCYNKLGKIRPSDGALLGYKWVTNPYAVIFDGTNIWVSGAQWLYKLNKDTIQIAGQYAVPGGALAFDGQSLWVGPSQPVNLVTKVNPTDGAVIDTYSVGTTANSMVFDGANVWVANANSDNVTKLRASDGANLGTYVVGDGPIAAAFDGASVWIANTSSNTVSKL